MLKEMHFKKLLILQKVPSLDWLQVLKRDGEII